MPECLLIDRNEAERKRVMAHLEGLGLRIVERSAATEALRYCNDNFPDVVLMAAQGADIEAGDFIRHMRKSRQGRRPVVIVYGPQSHAAKIGKTILEGAAEFVMLPVDCDMLGFKLRQTGVL